MRFKIDWASLIVGSKFIVFALFYFVFEGHFPSTSPPEAYSWWGDLTEGFALPVWGYLEGLIFGILRFFLEKLAGLAILMLISRKLVQRKGIGEKCGFFATRRPSPKGLKESVIPSPPLPSPSEEKCLFYDQHSFLKQG